MARRYLPVNEVIEGVKGWTVLAQVVERGYFQLSREARPVNYRRFFLTDSEGTKVSTVIYSNDIHIFVAMLMPFTRYYISNAALRKAESRYKVSGYPYSWVIHNRTLVEEYVEQVPPIITCQFELTAFENLFRFADTENLQNIQGIVVHAFPSREQGLDSMTGDLVVINQRNRPMLLTLWNEFEANEGAQLANTIANNIAIIAMRVKACKLSASESPNSSSHCIKAMVKTAWMGGNTSLAAEQRFFWYAACSNCQKAVDANLEWIIRCLSCRKESAVEAR